MTSQEWWRQVRRHNRNIMRQSKTLSTQNFTQSQRNEWIAGLGVARCYSIMQSIVCLANTGRYDTSGSLCRVLFETWFVSEFMVLGGHDAATKLHSAYGFEIDRLNKNLSSDIQPIKTDLSPQQLKIAELVTTLTKLLTKINDSFSYLPQSIYDVGYRGESFLSIHAGQGSFSFYAQKGHQNKVIFEPDTQLIEDRIQNEFAMSGLMMAHLNIHLFRSIGLDHSELETSLHAIHKLIVEKDQVQKSV